MFRRAARVGLLPGLLVGVVLASAVLMPGSLGPYRLVCGGYGTGTCPAPDITSVQPGAGPIFGGTTVTIMGTNFNNIKPPATKPTVMFDGNAATVISFTDTKIVAVSPAHAAAVVDVTVTTFAGVSAVDPGDQFRYVSASYCALIDMSRAPTSWTKGHAQKFYVFVFNCGTKTWPATGYTRVDINVHFTTKLGSGYNTQQYWKTQSYRDLGRNVAPNASYAFTITLNPTFTGSVWLEAEMIKKHQLWFGRYLYRPAQFVYVPVTVS